MVLGSCELDIRDKHSCKGRITHRKGEKYEKEIIGSITDGSYVRKRFERLR